MKKILAILLTLAMLCVMLFSVTAFAEETSDTSSDTPTEMGTPPDGTPPDGFGGGNGGPGGGNPPDGTPPDGTPPDGFGGGNGGENTCHYQQPVAGTEDVDAQVFCVLVTQHEGIQRFDKQQ